MNAEARFRRLALALPDAVESSHMGAADFRLNDRIFATLAYVRRGQATLKLTPEQQAMFLADVPEHTEPAPGGWGRMGMTLIRLDAPRRDPPRRPPHRLQPRKGSPDRAVSQTNVTGRPAAKAEA